jgi:beta-apo-4'-carotenal oxygenase
MAAATTKATAIPAFQPTAIDEIPAIVETLRRTYGTNRTKDMDYRITQIRKFYWSIVDNIPLIEEALYKDLRKSKYEATLTEIDWCKAECLTLVKELKKWAKDEPVVNVPLQFYPMRHKIRNEPMGLVLIISAYNYPFQLSLPAVAGAIAAGNCVVLKPSEASSHSAMVLQKIFQEALDPDCYRVINGNVAETKQILDLKWDKISFTGGKKIGTIVAQKAAETLTPVLLELGGCNPAFVNKGANIEKAARRLLWGKTLNSGQVCLSQNYILIDRTMLSQFIGAINKQYKTFMPQGAKASPDYARLGNKAMFDKCKRMLDNTKGRIVMGGTMDEADLFIEPTLVLVDSIEDSMMVDESFGPIFSIMAYDTLDQAIEIANKVDPTPLGLFTFGSDAENEKGKPCRLSIFSCFCNFIC